MQTIDAAMRVASEGTATLVVLSLVTPAPRQRAQSVCLEPIHQSKGFLEAVHWQSIQYHCATERYEVFTTDVPGSIATQVHALDCQSIILVSRGRQESRSMQESLLSAEELKQVLTRPPASLLFLTVLARAPFPPLGVRFFSWLHRPY